jgi:hypothetical protein
MRRLINGVAIGLLALLLMVVGLFVSRVTWLQFNHHYKSMPQGWFHGRLSLKTYGHLLAFERDNPIFVEITARSEPRWFWRTPTNISYRRITLLVQGELSKHELNVELPSLAYQREDQSGILSSALLAHWMSGRESSSESVEIHQNAAWVLSLLGGLPEGRLPPPGHHPYGNDGFALRSGLIVPEGIDVRMMHDLYGIGFWWLDWVVLGGTMAGVWWFVKRRCRTIKAPGNEPA